MAEIYFKIPEIIEENPKEKEVLLNEVEGLIKKQETSIKTKKPVLEFVKQKYSTLKDVDICTACGVSSFIFSERDDGRLFIQEVVDSGNYGSSYTFTEYPEAGNYVVNFGIALTLEILQEVLK